MNPIKRPLQREDRVLEPFQGIARKAQASYEPAFARLWTRNFLLYWLGVAATALGDALIWVALPFLVLEASHDPTAFATAVLFGSLPRLLGPLLGALADRVPLKVPLMLAVALRGGVFATLAFSAFQGRLSNELIYASALLSGSITYFVFAAGTVVLPRLVPKAQLVRANSAVQGVVQGVPLVGMGLAGVAVATFGAATTLLLATPLLAAFALLLPFIRLPGMGRRAVKRGLVADIGGALRFVARDPRLVSLVLITFVLNAALNTVNVTMPVLMDRLGVGAAGYGAFGTTLALGGIAGIACVGWVGGRLRLEGKIGLGLALFAVGFVLLAVGSFPGFIAGAFTLGLALGCTEVSAMAFSQRVVPDGMRGTVTGMKLSSGALGLALGAWLGGGAIQATGLAFTVAGLAIFVACAAWTLLDQASKRAAGGTGTLMNAR